MRRSERVSSYDVDWSALRLGKASHYGVSSEVHPDDLLWSFIAGHSLFPTPDSAASYYFADGSESAVKLRDLVTRHFGERPISVMEFASGYGMVTRHIPRALPSAHLVSCDIHPAAVSFIRDKLGVETLQSTHKPEDLDFGRRFDVVFALSFFSHMPENSFGRWLAALYRQVNPGGILVFTAHGLASATSLGNPDIPDSGFWFKPDSEQHDLEGVEYGSTISTPEWVIRTLYTRVGAPLAEARFGYWWQHQDLYVVAKPLEQMVTCHRSRGIWRHFGIQRDG
jgi:SAM-dependent methyltransferase